MSREIYVFADWEVFETPMLIGVLRADVVKGKEHFSFVYDDGWLHDTGAYLVQEATANDLIVVHPPGLLNGLLENYWGPTPVVTVAEGGMGN